MQLLVMVKLLLLLHLEQHLLAAASRLLRKRLLLLPHAQRLVFADGLPVTHDRVGCRVHHGLGLLPWLLSLLPHD